MSVFKNLKKDVAEKNDVRCKYCHRSLFRQVGQADAQIEIKCEKCKRICRIHLQVQHNFNNMDLPQIV